jgi:hypothetical protein
MKRRIGIGTAPNDGTGDCLREGGQKINQNFQDVEQEFLTRVISTQVSRIVALPREEYHQIELKHPTTLYIITD